MPVRAGWREDPGFFPAGGETLFGVSTVPERTNGIGVLFLQGAGFAPSSHHNRMWTTICRRIAATGFLALRLDWRGVGESSGVLTRIYLHDPPVEDVLAGAAVLGSRVERLVVVGTCLGARLAVAAADGLPRLEALGLLGLPVYDGTEGDEERAPADATLPPGVGPTFVHTFGRVLDRGIPCLALYGDEDGSAAPFRAALEGPLRGRGRDLVRNEMIAGTVEGRPLLGTQAEMLDLVEAWLRSVVPAGPGTEPRADAG